MSQRKPGAAVWDPTHRRLTIGLLLTISITAFEALAVATVLPMTAADLGGAAQGAVLAGAAGSAGGAATPGDLALGWYGWVFSGFMLANLVGIPAAGLFSDRRGPLLPFLGGSLLFACGLLAAGLAPSMPLLVVGRILQGLGAGALSSVAYVAVARGYDALDQPRMLALLASAWVLPGLMGPSAAAALGAATGWRSVYLTLVPLTFVAAALAAIGMRELGPASREQAAQDTPRNVARDAAPDVARGAAHEDAQDVEQAAREHLAPNRVQHRAQDLAPHDVASGAMSVRDALQLAAGSGLALAASEAEWLLVTLAGASAGIAIALPALVRLLPEGTLRARRGAPAALAAKALVTFAFFGAEAFLPLALTTVGRQSIAMAGAALTAGTLCWTGGTWLQERLVHRVDRRRLARIGLGLVAAAVAGAAGLLAAPWPAPVAIASWGLAGLGIGIAYPTTTLIVFDETPKGGEGGAASALQLANVLGVAWGSGVGGAILGLATAAGATQASAIAMIDAVMVAAALIGVVALRRPAPLSTATPSS